MPLEPRSPCSDRLIRRKPVCGGTCRANAGRRTRRTRKRPAGAVPDSGGAGDVRTGRSDGSRRFWLCSRCHGSFRTAEREGARAGHSTADRWRRRRAVRIDLGREPLFRHPTRRVGLLAWASVANVASGRNGTGPPYRPRIAAWTGRRHRHMSELVVVARQSCAVCGRFSTAAGSIPGLRRWGSPSTATPADSSYERS